MTFLFRIEYNIDKMREEENIKDEREGKGMKVEMYNLTTASGRHIRKATRVVFEGGTTISFTERMGKKAAIKAALKCIRS